MKRAFTLVELLVVIAVISILAAILFPVFARAKAAGKKAACLSNVRQIQMALAMYVTDSEGQYPQTKRTSANPAVDDADGAYEEPEYGTVFELVFPYVGSGVHVEGTTFKNAPIYSCPEDPDPFGSACLVANPDAPDVTSYLVNGFFLFGLNESAVTMPSSTIMFTERRSNASAGVPPYCDTLYREWWNPGNPIAPENDMDPFIGAVATTRHSPQANYTFVDGHAKSMAWTQTYAPPTIDLHLVDQP